MKLVVVFYLVFCAVFDPWIDGSAVSDVHSNVAVTLAGNELNSSSTSTTIENQKLKLPSRHAQEPAIHICHLGHCGTLVISLSFDYLPVKNVYSSFPIAALPDPILIKVRRPPKAIA
jgi:hypothetical protein